ncbi:phenylalanine--tRNA ligase subunit beta [Legionella spiritensis]|uniref:Phenylalanine--tRNA ligase beta subunit n=1 Tax=Legionella spiritensis TaxID=452 RepID=A0A0W0Z5D3_LEGSP|nr:phenylalanine--tRNA ligase subunit beta [Legionella spiritensis]KTD64368.1 phenylalanyl-tRNA synthetase subunit beta [Legionella spiritensis]SNV46278.1 Phenylalanyl-tRNA synthetase beta subunit [Legionella spiritensis]
MKVSELWLREWVNPSLDEQQLASLLTMAGLEVDAVNPVAAPFNQVIVAQVINTTPHPQADKLTLCDVDTGSGHLVKVVCGASNVRPGLKVALAQTGANLPGGILIKETTLRGELSQGMLCSASELGLAESSEGIMELDEDAPAGINLRDYLVLDDHILDIDLTPNRADCLSVLGVAREVAALTRVSLNRPDIDVCQPEIDEQLTVKLQNKQACPQYCGRIIKGIDSRASTPLWMRERLRRSGIRAIHPVVDVTNYVMLELGQPMHAFDLHRLQGDITVRFGKKDESFELLDGQTALLQEDVLVIADSDQILAIAGVMGGASSAVDESTTDVFLESAFFTPQAITGVARRYGLHTDSSQRFERGVDPGMQMMAMERATALLLSITGGKAGPLSIASAPEYLPSVTPIAFDPTKVRHLTGLDVREQEMTIMLEGLGMTVDKSVTPWRVHVPSHRFDISLDVDLIEEIVRMYGYDRIPGTKMVTTVQAGSIDPVELLSRRVSQFFTSRGYHETISYSFVDPELQQALYPNQDRMTLLNPISSELSQMRAGMWPGLIASMVYNTHRQQAAIKFIEQGVIFESGSDGLQEHPSFGGLLCGQHAMLSWLEESRPFDFYDLKGDLQALFTSLHLPYVQFVSAEHPALHPGKSARLTIANRDIGWCGVLHPRLGEALDLTDEVILFELKLRELLNPPTVRYHAISRFPQIRRDLSLLVDEQIAAADIKKVIVETANSSLLKSFDVFDVYTGESIPAGKKSLAVSLTLQDEDRTLTDTEINKLISAIIKKLDEVLAITLRD